MTTSGGSWWQRLGALFESPKGENSGPTYAELKEMVARLQEGQAWARRLLTAASRAAKERSARIRELEQALEFYAEPKNWRPGAHGKIKAQEDGGRRARDVLG